MRLQLVDLNETLVSAWATAFSQFPEVSIHHGDVLAMAENGVVSPANSHGFMDGGADSAYRDFFGEQIERQVQTAILRLPEGHLPVGASLVVRTDHPRVPYLIVAPTMTMPEVVEPRNCYRAMRALLRVAGENVDVGRIVFSPGLATGVGRVAPEVAALMMAEAYRDWKNQPELVIGH